MNIPSARLPKKFHDAVVQWQETFLPDFDLLLEHWDKLLSRGIASSSSVPSASSGCATSVECGDDKGQPKALKARELDPEQAQHLLAAIRAQASTEFGSIQQHQLTLARAQRRGGPVLGAAHDGRGAAPRLPDAPPAARGRLERGDRSQSSDDMVEEILSMQTGSHVLGAFNVDFDSFVDNIVFCALIDRVGKYQLSMQKVCAYKPMAESMPQMLREEAFHLADRRRAAAPLGAEGRPGVAVRSPWR